jgi:hypothetical protein
LLHILEQRLRPQARLNSQPLLDLLPNGSEWIASSAPTMFALHLARQPPISQVFPRCLRVHARFGCRDLQPQLPRRQPPKSLYLLITHHKSSDFYGLRTAAARNFNCRRQGNSIVVDQKASERESLIVSRS